MNRVESIRERDDVRTRAATVAVDADALAQIRTNLGRGVDCWVSAVVTDDGGRVLLLQNGWSDDWIPPGGNVEPGEDPARAAVREVREETGVEAAVEDPIAVVEETFTCDGRTAGGPRIAFAARAETTALADDPGLDGEGITDVGWFADLPNRIGERWSWLVERGRDQVP